MELIGYQDIIYIIFLFYRRYFQYEVHMTIEERVCGEDGAPMRDAGIQPDGSRMFVCTRDPGHVLFVKPEHPL
jgi:hypothetical protein